jgi:ferredoxin
MTYIVVGNCQDCRFTDCVEVCPVDCFYGDARMLYIHPDECIDCGACVPACPVEAIYPEADVPESDAKWTPINIDICTNELDSLENVTEKVDPLPTAEEKKTSLGF